MMEQKDILGHKLIEAIDKEMEGGSKGDLAAVKLALAEGAKADYQNGYAVRHAVEHNNVDIARFLIEEKKLSLWMPEGTIKRLVTEHREKSQEMLQLLSESAAPVKNLLSKKTFILQLIGCITGSVENISADAKAFKEEFLPSLIEEKSKIKHGMQAPVEGIAL